MATIHILSGSWPRRSCAGSQPGARRSFRGMPAYSPSHVIEPFDLAEDEQASFFFDAIAAARGLWKLFDSVKMSYEIHGNTVPHLHMHLFPRTPGDVYVGYPNHCRALFTRTDEEISLMREAVRAELSGRLLSLAVSSAPCPNPRGIGHSPPSHRLGIGSSPLPQTPPGWLFEQGLNGA
jgi:hypothetical protein